MTAPLSERRLAEYAAQVEEATQVGLQADQIFPRYSAMRVNLTIAVSALLGEVGRLNAHVADLENQLAVARTGAAEPTTETTSSPEPTATGEALSPAARAAQEIQALHDPIVCGYLIGIGTLRIVLHPVEWQQWQEWTDRLGVKPATSILDGDRITAEGHWGDVPVTVTAHLDKLPQEGPDPS